MTDKVIAKINAEFLRRKKINSSYSLRAFARHMGISVSILSRITRKQMPVSLKILQRISAPLSLTPEEFEIFKNEIVSRQEFLNEELITPSEHRSIGFDDFYLIQDWYNFVILEMVKLDDFEPNEKWIAKKLNISREEAFVALERLVRLELIVKNDSGSFSKSISQLTIVQNHLSSDAMRNRQKQVLARASMALDLVEFSKRDQSSITLSADSSLMPEIKLRIKKMRRSLANYISNNSKKKDHVYELSISFFPWSN